MEGALKIDRGWLLAAVFLAGFLAYTPALKAPFFWDDYVSIPEIQQYRGIEHTESRPLRALSFYLDSFLWKGNAAGYHFTNILLAALCGALAFLFLEELLKDRAQAFFASLLFTLHPVHTEAVVWIKNRTELLFFAFFILAFLARKKSLLLSVVLFSLCALSKETSVIFPVVLTFYIYFFEKNKDHRSTMPFYLIAVVRGAYSLMHAEAIVGPGSVGGLAAHASLFLNTYGFYLEKLFYPARLLVDWPASAAFSPAALLAFLALAGSMFLARLGRPARFLLFLLFVSILPYSNIVFIAGRPLGEQRMFLPSLAFTALLTLLLFNAVKAKVLRYSLLSGAVAAGGARTFLRAAEWRDPVLLWEQAEKINPDSPRIKHNLGGIHYERGDYAKARKYYLRGIGRSTDPEGFRLLSQNLALVSLRENDLPEAERILKGVLEARPGDPAVLYNLGVVCIRAGKYAEAAAYLEKASILLPENLQVYNNLAVAYMEGGRPEAAVEALKKAIAAEPGYSRGVYNLILVYKRSGRGKEALAETEKALKLFPGDPAFIKLYQELKV
ncbi:MAG TPA: tetratricopeptide repeat protein [Elusimicrobiales bacterium]|nr:tetratricopeptide repeat protein [Elusimicrobiales bacterium]